MRLVREATGEAVEDPRAGIERMLRTAFMAILAYEHLIREELGEGLLVNVGSMAAGFREEPHPYVKLWNDERDRYTKTCKVAIDAGFAERQVKVAEEQSRQYMALINAGIVAARLAPGEAQRVRRSIAAQFADSAA